MRPGHRASPTVGDSTSVQLRGGESGPLTGGRGDAIRLLVALSSLHTTDPLTAAECAAVLRSGKYGLHLAGEPAAFVIETTTGETVASLSSLPSLWQLYALLIAAGRTRRNNQPGWLHDTAWQIEADTGRSGWPELTADRSGGRGSGIRQRAELHTWRSLAELCRADALLRLHAVTRVPDELPADHPWPGTPPLRPGLVHPPHPGYPGGTFAVDLAALLAPLGDGKLLLATVVEHANPTGLAPAAFVREFFVRPLFTVFRVLLDGHRALLPIHTPRDVAFEFSPELRPTGRVVLTAQAGQPAADADQVATAMWSAAWQLADAVRRSGLDDSADAPLTATIERVAAEELRFLHAETVPLLRGANPLRPLLHTVHSAQSTLLAGVLARIEDAVRRRRADPGLLRPAVVIRQRSTATLPGYLDFLRDLADVGGTAVILAGSEVGTAVDDDLDVLAEFDILGAESSVAVGAAGAVVVREPSGPPPIRLQVIADFQRLPRPAPPTHAPDGPALSHTHSIAELPLAELRPRLAARDHRARLSLDESLAIIRSLRTQAADSAARTVAATRKQLVEPAVGADDPHIRTALFVHHVLTRKQFHRGSRSTYPPAAALHDTLGFIRRGEPIQIVLPGFPVKQADSRLKAFGHRPDLAELAVLIRLGELSQAIEAFHPPGLRIAALSDGLHFRSRPAHLVHEYAAVLRDYLDLAGGGAVIDLLDVDESAARRLGADLPQRRGALRHRYREAYREALAAGDLLVDPLWTLAAAARTDPTPVLVAAVGGSGGPGFVDMFRSILHSVDLPAPAGHDQQAWSKQVYADPYGLHDTSAPAEIRDGRRRLLGTVWRDTIDYMSGLLADRELGYDRVYPERIRMTLSTPAAGRCGFAPLGGAAVLPWHGTAALNRRGEVSVDFAISLCDQGFVPVYSPLLGDSQPWFMVPATSTEVRDLADGGAVSAELLASVRLRRR